MWSELMWFVWSDFILKWSEVMWSELMWFVWSDFILKWSEVMWSELMWFVWSDFILKWSEVMWSELMWFVWSDFILKWSDVYSWININRGWTNNGNTTKCRNKTVCVGCTERTLVVSFIILLFVCALCSSSVSALQIVFSKSLYAILTLRLPWLKFFRAFSSVVRQMAGYNSQRRGTASTLPS